MNRVSNRLIASVLVLSLLAMPRLWAQDDPGAEERAARAEEAEARRQEMEIREEEIELRLKEAQARLEEAAREVAELSLEMSGVAADPDIRVVRRVERRVGRAMLGITIAPIDTATGTGVPVGGVTPDGPADEAGIKAGDVLTRIGDTALDTAPREATRTLIGYLKTIEPGDEVEVELRRDGEMKTVDVTTEAFGPMVWAYGGEEAPDFEVFVSPDEPAIAPPVFGGPHFYSSWGRMELVPLTEGLGEYFGTDSGLLVVRAPRDERLGLQDGDVLKSIDGREPEGVAHAMRILRSYAPGEKMKMEIVRKQRKQTLEIEVPDRRMSGRIVPRPPRPARVPLPPKVPGDITT